MPPREAGDVVQKAGPEVFSSSATRGSKRPVDADPFVSAGRGVGFRATAQHGSANSTTGIRGVMGWKGAGLLRCCKYISYGLHHIGHHTQRPPGSAMSDRPRDLPQLKSSQVEAMAPGSNPVSRETVSRREKGHHFVQK